MLGWLALLLAVIGLYWALKWRRTEAQRDLIVDRYQTAVAPTLAQADAFKTELLERLAVAKKGAAERLVNPQLTWPALADASVVYVRLRAADLRDDTTALNAVGAQNEDALAGCFGLGLRPAKDAFASLSTLNENWHAEVKESGDVFRLRVRQHELDRAIANELPSIAAAANARYLMALVIQGKSRLTDPVDVFVWDRTSDALVLRARTESTGKLITVRNAIADGDKPDTSGDPIVAADCSIATNIKAIF